MFYNFFIYIILNICPVNQWYFEKIVETIVGQPLRLPFTRGQTVLEVILERETRESSAKKRENQNFAFFRVFFASFAFKIPRSSATGKPAEEKKLRSSATGKPAEGKKLRSSATGKPAEERKL
jgi:hypothetical protein